MSNIIARCLNGPHNYDDFGAVDAGRITTQLGTPRGRYDEHNSKFFPK
jgi:hypothetical protein